MEQVSIYKLTNELNGMAYVGMTNNLKRRLSEHRRYSKRANSYLSRAIFKYGWENFRVEVLEVCSKEVAKERERHWIKELGTREPQGYNCTDGGDKGSKYSAESCMRRSAVKIQNSVFPVLAAELEKRMITRKTLSRMLGGGENVVTDWLNGRYEIKFSTAIKIKEILGVDMPLEELFAKAPVQKTE